MADADLPGRAALEAVLLVADEPIETRALADAVDATPAAVEAWLAELRADYEAHGHGLVIRHVGGGWRLATRASTAGPVERFLRAGRSTRLSAAAMETLAVVAYEQPVTRGRIAQVRGVDPDGALRTLVVRGLVAEAGRADTLGQPVLYVTTTELLERLALDSIDDLPPLAALDQPGPAPAEPPVGGYVQARRDIDALERIDAPPR